jgi:hypothetical protein
MLESIKNSTFLSTVSDELLALDGIIAQNLQKALTSETSKETAKKPIEKIVKIVINIRRSLGLKYEENKENDIIFINAVREAINQDTQEIDINTIIFMLNLRKKVITKKDKQPKNIKESAQNAYKTKIETQSAVDDGLINQEELEIYYFINNWINLNSPENPQTAIDLACLVATKTYNIDDPENAYFIYHGVIQAKTLKTEGIILKARILSAAIIKELDRLARSDIDIEIQDRFYNEINKPWGKKEEELNQYLVYHIIIGSTPLDPTSKKVDLPGKESMLLFLEKKLAELKAI